MQSGPISNNSFRTKIQKKVRIGLCTKKEYYVPDQNTSPRVLVIVEALATSGQPLTFAQLLQRTSQRWSSLTLHGQRQTFSDSHAPHRTARPPKASWAHRLYTKHDYRPSDTEGRTWEYLPTRVWRWSRRVCKRYGRHCGPHLWGLKQGNHRRRRMPCGFGTYRFTKATVPPFVNARSRWRNSASVLHTIQQPMQHINTPLKRKPSNVLICCTRQKGRVPLWDSAFFI